MLRRVSNHIETIIVSIRALVSEFERGVARNEFANEEDVTSQFARGLKTALNITAPDFSIQCRAVVTKKTTEEPTLGADILVVISLDSPELSYSKGFLAQAKNVDLGRSIGSRARMAELQSQCANMLDQSPESYVWLYSGEQFRVQRAVTVKSISTNTPDDALSHPFEWFFYDFLISMRGDPSITLQDYPRLQGIIDELRIPFVLLISASASGGDRPRGGGAPSPDGGPPDLDSLVEMLGGIPIEQWAEREKYRMREQEAWEEEQSSEQEDKPQQKIWLSE